MYGEKVSRPFPVWNGLLEKKHFERIGPALWVYEWLLDRITKEAKGVGLVLGGRPIKASEIAETYGIHERTARAHIDRLKKNGYLTVTLAPYGLIIRVLNSMKFGIWRPSNRSDRNALPQDQRSEENYGEVGRKTVGGWKESSDVISTQQDSAQNAVAEPLATSDLWNLIGVSAGRMPPAFRDLCEHLYPTRNGKPLAAFMGTCLDAWAAMGEKRYPPEFARAKARIVASEKEKASAGGQTELVYLPPLPPIRCN